MKLRNYKLRYKTEKKEKSYAIINIDDKAIITVVLILINILEVVISVFIE